MRVDGPDDVPEPISAEPRSDASPNLASLPDADRISSVETVRQYVEQHLNGVPPALPGWSEGRPPQAPAPGEAPAEEAAPPQAAAPLPTGPPEDTITRPWSPPAPGDGKGNGEAAGLLPGQQAPIDQRYEILQRLATGGMAEILLVRHRGLGKDFALKLIHAGTGTDANRMRQLFFREARLVSRMEHPHIVSVTDFGVDPERGEYIVMEYLRGETLHHRLHRQRRLKLHTALEIALQVAEALHYMHVQGVIHCDVKAENVFLCRTQSDSRRRIAVKLIDFGLSRLRSTDAALVSGDVGGTPQYMAPELIRGTAPQPSMDIYALGVLLYEMITGEVPFQGKSRADTLRAHLVDPPSRPSALLPEPLESRVEDFLLETLAKDPGDRPRSMGQVIFQLRTLAQMYGYPAAARVRRQTPPERPAVSAFRACRDLLDASPLPQFQLDAEGRLLFANKAFYRFVRARPEELRGTLIGETRLGLVYPSVQTDAESCARRRRGEPLRRAFAFELKDGTRSSMLCWLVREEVEAGKAARVQGYIHPLG